MDQDKLRIDSIFLGAVELSAAEERAAYLDKACGSDGRLRERIERLLAAQSKVDGFLEAPAPGVAATVDETPVSGGPGTVIGQYKLLEQIGEGGFGVVFMAEQTQPVRRKVALKILKPGMDTRQVVARFEAERQALALMDHPNIAHILDGGETASGRPYFVMELVRGVPITEFCDQNRLPVRQRLELFLSVCQAVQHAHHKGIIHRDIKPSNVLVTLHDDKAVVKVIDFGIAKATGQQLTDKTLFTNFAQMIGTPLYMSPEQAQMSGLDVDTRSDIYSLGVLLYELLTGTTPFDKERLRTVGFDEIRRIIREEEPPKPSTRLSTLAQAATTSANRQSDPKRLSQLLRGELDWIVMKSLEKDRNRRYETASAFAADVQRYLNDEAVLACPPSAWYWFGKFARRNKAALVTTWVVGMAALVAVGSLVWILYDKANGLVHTTYQVDRALGESAGHQHQGRIPKALQAIKEAEALLEGGTADELLRQRVQERARDLQMIAELEDARLELYAASNDFFDSIDPARLDDVYARLFQKYELQVEGLDAAEAGKRIKARTVAVEVAAGLDNWAMSRWLKWHRGRRKADPGPWKHLLVVASIADPDDMRNRVRKLLETMDQKTLAELIASVSPAKLPVPTILQVAEVLGSTDPQALALLRRAQQLHPDNFWINHHLAFYLQKTQPTPWDEVIRYYSAALACRPDDPAVCLELGNALVEKGNLEEAEAHYLRAIKFKPDYGTAHFCLGNNYRDRGDFDKAQQEYLEAIAINGQDHEAYLNLGGLHLRQKKWAKAAESYRKVVDLQPKEPLARILLGQCLLEAGELVAAAQTLQKMLDDKMKSAEAYYVLGRVEQVRQNWLSAEKLFQQATQEKPVTPRRHRQVSRIEKFNIYFNLAVVLEGQKKFDEALKAYGEVVKLKKDFAEAHHNLGVVYVGQKNWPAAQASFAAAVGIKKDYAEAHFGLGTALLMLKKRSEAIAHFQEAVKLRPAYHEAHFNLGLLLEGRGDLLQAAEHFRATVQYQPKFARAHYQLGLALYHLNKLAEAEKALRQVVALDPRDGWAHYSLGLVVSDGGHDDEAEKWYRKAIALQPDLAEAHCNLGHLLRQRGEFAEALRWLRSGHEEGLKIQKDPGIRRTGWNYPSLRWVQECEVLVERDKKLTEALMGDAKKRTGKDAFELAAFCLLHKRPPATAAKFYAEALEADGKLTADQRAEYLYDAGLAAARAGTGQGLDAAKLDDKERARWRKQAFHWLQDASMHWAKRLEQGTLAEKVAIRQRLDGWQKDADLAGLRNQEGPAAQPLWAAVQALLKKAEAATPAALVVGNAIKGALPKDDPIDAFPLTQKSHHKVHTVLLEAGQPYLIDLQGSFDTFLRIENSRKQPLLCNDDIRPDDLNSRLVFLPPQTATYRLVVTSFKEGDTGSYTLSIQKAATVGKPTLVEDKLQDTDKKNQGRFFKMYKLRLNGGSPYTIELESRAFDTFLVLLDGTGKQVLSQNDAIAPGHKQRSRIDFTPGVDAAFTVVVTSFGQGETGTFRLTVQRYEAVQEKQKP